MACLFRQRVVSVALKFPRAGTPKEISIRTARRYNCRSKLDILRSSPPRKFTHSTKSTSSRYLRCGRVGEKKNLLGSRDAKWADLGERKLKPPFRFKYHHWGEIRICEPQLPQWSDCLFSVDIETPRWLTKIPLGLPPAHTRNPSVWHPTIVIPVSPKLATGSKSEQINPE